MQSNKLVSIIITTRNEADVIADLLQSCINQTYKSIEIIVVDNNSIDDTTKIVRQHRGVTLYNFGPERSAQRNFGAKKSHGQFLLFLDADMKLTPKVVEACVAKYGSQRAIGGVAIPEESVAVTFWERVKAFERSFYNAQGDPITDAARFFPKKIFDEVGGYDETITGPEDWDLPETVRERGYKIARVDKKIYHRERATSLASLFRKKFYYGIHAKKYLDKHNIPMMSPKTVYFLRPLFYKSWRRLINRPDLALGMIIMLTVQTMGGAIGYFVGMLKGYGNK